MPSMVPKVPPAPGLLSITTGCPNTLVAPSAAALASKSLAPPDAKGTISLMGLLGQVLMVALAGVLVCAHVLLTIKLKAAKVRPAAD